MFVAVRSTVEEVRRLLGGLDPQSCTPAEAAGLLTELGLLARTATAGVTLLADRAALSTAWRKAEASDVGAWVGQQAGMNVFDGRRLLEASRLLTPAVRDAMVDQGLAPLKAAEVLRARRAAEAARARWLDAQTRTNDCTDDAGRADAPDAAACTGGADLAGTPPPPVVPPTPPGKSPDQVEQELLDLGGDVDLRRLREEADRQAAAARDQDQQRRHLHATRSWRQRTWEDGAAGGEYRFAPDIAARINALIDAETRDVFADARRAGRHEPRAAYAADAFLRLLGITPPTPPIRDCPSEPRSSATTAADIGRATAASTTLPTDASSTYPVVPPRSTDAAPLPLEQDTLFDIAEDPPPPAPAATPRVRGRRPRAIVRADAEALARGDLVPGDICELHGTGPVPLADAARLLATSRLYVVLHHDGTVLNVTKVGRRRPPDTGLLPPGRGRDPDLDTTGVLRIDVRTLRRDLPRVPFLIADGAPALDRRKLERLIGGLSEQVEARGVAVRTVVFDQRTWPDEVRIAAFEEQPRCADCGTPYGLEDDHDHPAALGGPTTLANCTRRCHRDHAAKTRREAPRTTRAGRWRARSDRTATLPG